MPRPRYPAAGRGSPGGRCRAHRSDLRPNRGPLRPGGASSGEASWRSSSLLLSFLARAWARARPSSDSASCSRSATTASLTVTRSAAACSLRAAKRCFSATSASSRGACVARGARASAPSTSTTRSASRARTRVVPALPGVALVGAARSLVRGPGAVDGGRLRRARHAGDSGRAEQQVPVLGGVEVLVEALAQVDDDPAGERERHDRRGVVDEVVDHAEVGRPPEVRLAGRGRRPARCARRRPRRSGTTSWRSVAARSTVPGADRLERGEGLDPGRGDQVVVVEDRDIASAGDVERVVERRRTPRALDLEHAGRAPAARREARRRRHARLRGRRDRPGAPRRRARGRGRSATRAQVSASSRQSRRVPCVRVTTVRNGRAVSSAGTGRGRPVCASSRWSNVAGSAAGWPYAGCGPPCGGGAAAAPPGTTSVPGTSSASTSAAPAASSAASRVSHRCTRSGACRGAGARSAREPSPATAARQPRDGSADTAAASTARVRGLGRSSMRPCSVTAPATRSSTTSIPAAWAASRATGESTRPVDQVARRRDLPQRAEPGQRSPRPTQAASPRRTARAARRSRWGSWALR